MLFSAYTQIHPTYSCFCNVVIIKKTDCSPKRWEPGHKTEEKKGRVGEESICEILMYNIRRQKFTKFYDCSSSNVFLHRHDTSFQLIYYCWFHAYGLCCRIFFLYNTWIRLLSKLLLKLVHFWMGLWHRQLRWNVQSPVKVPGFEFHLHSWF